MTIVITGASDGLGYASAKQLKTLGYEVVIVGRNPEKTKRVATELNAPYHVADYASLSDVVRLAEELSVYEHIDVLCNNAGGMFGERTVTIDGYEKTFQVNVLGGFLLTNLLMDKLVSSKAKVIQTSSIASNLFAKRFDLNDLQSERYQMFDAYGNSKLCVHLLTKEYVRRFNLNAVSFEPGIVRSNFGTEANAFLNFAFHSPLKYLFTVPREKSAERLVRLAVGEFEKGEMYSGTKRYKVKGAENSTVSNALWNACEEMCKIYLEK